MDYYELKKHRLNNTRPRKDGEYNIPVLITFSTYTDNGPGYEQQTRFARASDLDDLQLIKCIDCGRLMDGGRYANDKTKQQCYTCYKEGLLRDILLRI